MDFHGDTLPGPEEDGCILDCADASSPGVYHPMDDAHAGANAAQGDKVLVEGTPLTMMVEEPSVGALPLGGLVREHGDRKDGDVDHPPYCLVGNVRPSAGDDVGEREDAPVSSSDLLPVGRILGEDLPAPFRVEEGHNYAEAGSEGPGRFHCWDDP